MRGKKDYKMEQVQWMDEVLKRKDRLLEKCHELLSIPSILDESTAQPGAPFGRNIAKALHYMLDLGRYDGFVTKNIDGYAGHIELGNGDEYIGVLSHIDVVPAGGGWTSPPFSPEIREGKLYARGAMDDKGPTMAAYIAMKIVKDLGFPLSKRVRLIIGTDEETKWRCMKRYFMFEKMPTMGFTPDADFPMIIGEKGLLSFKLVGSLTSPQVKKDEWRLEEFWSGERINLVPDLAIVKLKGEGDVFQLKEEFQSFLFEHRLNGFAEEADDHVTLQLQGIAHHAFEPDQGLNAALAMTRFLSNIRLDSQGARYIRLIDDRFVDSFFGEKLGIQQEDDRLGALTLNAGVFRYQSGNSQEIDVNIRHPLQTDVDQLIKRIKENVAEYQVHVTDIDHLPAHYVHEHHPLITILSTVYEQQTGEPARLLTTGGGTYARVLKTGVAFGPVFPGKVETAHQRNEYIEIDDLLKATAIYAQAIYELAR